MGNGVNQQNGMYSLTSKKPQAPGKYTKILLLIVYLQKFL